MIVQRKVAGMLCVPGGIFLLVLCLCFAFSDFLKEIAGAFIVFSLILLPVLILPSVLLGIANYLKWMDVRQYRSFRQWLKPWGLALLLSMTSYHLLFYLALSADDPDGIAGATVYFAGVAEVLLSPVWIALSALWYTQVSAWALAKSPDFKTPAPT